MSIIPDAYAGHIIAMHGDIGAAWLASLPATIAHFAAAWELTVAPPFPNLSYNYVAPVTRCDGTPAVLKVGLPADHEFGSEQAALSHFAGRGAVRLLAAGTTASARAMLLTRVLPGTPLTMRWEEDATISIAADVMRALWRPAADPTPFRTIADWGAGFARMRRRFNGGSGPIPAAWAARAEADFAALVASQAAPVLLHGDLHHDNILAAGPAAWLAIDPKGVIGEPAYETGSFLRNPGSLCARPDARAITAHRIDRFAATLGLDRERIRAWAFAQAVLSAWWTIEDNSSHLDHAQRMVEVFAALDHLE